MRFSILISALVAVIVGFGGSVAIVIEAANAVGADQNTTSSWIAALCLAMMATSITLSYWQRLPIVTAWSTPGAALIATSTGLTLEQASTAFILCGLLTLLTAATPFLEKIIRKIPTSIAGGVLAGVLFPFVQAVVGGFASNIFLTCGMVGTFLILRPISSAWAVIGVLMSGLAIAFVTSPEFGFQSAELAYPKFVHVEWNWTAALGLGLPLFIVTMASQNLPGLAVLQSAGFEPETKAIFSLTGLATVIGGFFGAHSIGLAAITASICVSEEAHPNKSKRWMTGICYGVMYGVLAFCAPTLVGFFAKMPTEFIVILAGVALTGPMISALSSALEVEANRFPGIIAFVVTASGLSFFEIGSAFWGLVASLLTIGISNSVNLVIHTKHGSAEENVNDYNPQTNPSLK